jgi:serine/threonine-protein kinase RsbW
MDETGGTRTLPGTAVRTGIAVRPGPVEPPGPDVLPGADPRPGKDALPGTDTWPGIAGPPGTDAAAGVGVLAGVGAAGGDESAGPEPDPIVATRVFTRDSLGQVCTLVRGAGVAATMTARRVEDLLIAVNEIVTNVVRHGGGTGTLTIRRQPTSLMIEVRDQGPGLPDTWVLERPAPDAIDGRGLWLARILCASLDVISSAGGVTVRMSMPCGLPA